ncbi:MAG: hypothetical protein ACLT8E_04455 [Akkermansia sp.]
MTFGVDINRADLINNVTLLAKAAKLFQVPTVITAVETEASGYVGPSSWIFFRASTSLNTSMNPGIPTSSEGHQGDGRRISSLPALDGSASRGPPLDDRRRL